MDRVDKMRKKQQQGNKTFEQLFTPQQQADLKDAANKYEALCGSPPAKVTSGTGDSCSFPGKKSPKPEKAAKAMVRFRCNHEKPVEAFKGTDCGECRAKLQREKALRRREKFEAEKAARPPQERKQWLDDQGRLPHAAVFEVAYDGHKQEWCGTLTVPHGDGRKEFAGAGGGVEGLLRTLAKECRQWLAQYKPEG